ncbi:DUF6262 family protein [Kribbella sp. DT2]|uniref:DUF6262 family protein n=1 Tax=Kribbella sp. DT2 TaxID=3393427 RepID=UPI003CEF7F1D
MSEHLVRAAKARHDDVMKRATKALQEMAKAGEAITFVAVARRAEVSTDFLYSTPTLRSKILELRGGRHAPTSAPPQDDGTSSTSAIRALSTQLKEQRHRHRHELEALQRALAAAHGENLKLRRRLAYLDDQHPDPEVR